MVNVLKFQTLHSNLLFMQLFLKTLSGMAKSVDLDETAHSGAALFGSALFAFSILSDTLVYKILGHLAYIYVSGYSLNWMLNITKKKKKSYMFILKLTPYLGPVVQR